MATDDDFKPTTGRFGRLARLASLGARLSGEVVSKGVKRLAGGGDEGALGHGAAEKLVATLGELKGLAMKVGQTIAMDPDLLTPEVRAVVARLQNQAPPMPYDTVREVVREGLGGWPEELFASFEQKALAAASLGQVHRAVTRDGRAVAVKVQYPDIRKAMMSDLENVGALVSVVARTTRVSESKAYFDELREDLLGELDYTREAQRARLFHRACKKFPELVVPEPVEALSSAKVLTLELLPGETLKDFLAQRPLPDNAARFRVSGQLIMAIWGPFLDAGVIHADPHPGNFLLMPDGRLGVLDFGSIKALSPKYHQVNRALFHFSVGGPPVDALALSREVGFTITLSDAEARPFIEEVMRLGGQSAASRDFDFATSGVNRDMKMHFVRNATKLPGMTPPKEAVLFFKGIGGLLQNLENLGARGDFRAVHEEIARRVGLT